jgi:hypothetical protein
MKRKLIFTLPTFLLAFMMTAQSSNPIQWGNVEKYRGQTQKIVNINNQSFTVVVNRSGFFSALFPNSQKVILREVASLNAVSESKIQLKGDGRNLFATDVVGLNRDLITISQRMRTFEGKNEMFLHQFNASNPSGAVEGEKVISYFVFDAPSQTKQIGMMSSEDFSKVAAFYTIPVRPNEFPGFGYVLFDQAKGKYAQHVTQLPYMNFQLDFSDAFLANNGDFYVLANEFYPMNPNMPISPMNRVFAKIKAFKAVDGKFSEFEVNQPGFIVQNMKMATDKDNNFVASGFYADDIYSGVRGVFFMVLDRETNAVLRLQKQPFTAEFLNSGVAAWEQSWRDRNRQNATKPQALADFRVLDFRQTQDGGYVVITENQSVELVARQTGTPENPRITYTERFFFDDLIVYRLDAAGTLQWVRRLPKNQMSNNDGGQHLGIAHGVTDRSVHILFNDIRRNYGSDGRFLEGQFPFPVQFMAGNNVIGYINMNLETGAFTRVMLPGLTENKVILVPHLCEFNYNTKEMIVYGQRNRKHRFGHLRLQ